MKILIADDEYLVRESLIALLEEALLKPDIIQTTNGTETLEKVQNFYPDIAFIDIRMPGMNGLEAIRHMKEHCPHTQFIILTGYSRFEYAKEALELGVKSYLLKPITLEELTEALNVASVAKKQMDLYSNSEFEKDIWHFNKWKCSGKIQTLKIIPESSDEANFLLLVDHLRQLIEKYINHQFYIALKENKEQYIDCICYWDFKAKDNHEDNCFDSFYNHLLATLKTFKFPISLVASSECPQVKDLKKAYHQIDNLSLLRIGLGIGRAYSLCHLQSYYRALDDKSLKLLVLSEHLSKYYLSQKYLEYMKIINSEPFNSITTTSRALTKPIMTYLSTRLPLNLTQGTDLLTALKACGESILVKSASTQKDPVEQMKQYIHSNYMKDIGISEIADQLDLTPNYISTLFKRQTNKTFLSYLTEVRMLKAKELLASPLTISDITSRVGYCSTRHFSKTFKKYYKKTPTAYREDFLSH
ncbi:response regulator transcription factor [Vallitalea okinawensis]|uniref:response regulator transcription factor n=1 Tax=Vallitalea okinawensis TaxID=2078660 RepID=UPI0014784F3E|nr:response regulator [Vallitalea okinawensis]